MNNSTKEIKTAAIIDNSLDNTTQLNEQDQEIKQVMCSAFAKGSQLAEDLKIAIKNDDDLQSTQLAAKIVALSDTLKNAIVIDESTSFTVTMYQSFHLISVLARQTQKDNTLDSCDLLIDYLAKQEKNWLTL